VKAIYRSVLYVGTTLAALLTLYVLAYTLLVEVNDQTIVNLGIAWTNRVPTYRIGGEFAEMLFQPIHIIDCWLRPEVWEGYEGLSPSAANGGGFF
jgi:hypothetical protein